MDASLPPQSNKPPDLSQSSQTAQEYISSQLQLESEAREALPYQFDTCTKPLGPLRQSVFACLTCTPPPASPHQQFQPAGVCYSCSISCHGEHDLVELFNKRNFTCDCGTTRFQNGAECGLRLNLETGRKGGVKGEPPALGNKYDHNYAGKFCGCNEEYDPEKEKGTMFQCLGLGTVDNGGCGEDWWHPECLMGLPRAKNTASNNRVSNGEPDAIKKDLAGSDAAENQKTHQDFDEEPLPTGFPAEDDFDHLICYKCVEVCPWIKQYAGTVGFLPALRLQSEETSAPYAEVIAETTHPTGDISKKRKAEDDNRDEDKVSDGRLSPKRARPAFETLNGDVSNLNVSYSNGDSEAKHAQLPHGSTGRISLFLKDDFRDQICRCPSCFPRLAEFPQLLEEEDSYEPPLSESDNREDGAGSAAGRSVHSGSLLERGEAALSGMDRVRAIEGVMAYNHLRDKVKAFLQPFAESGQAVGAEDVKAYFAKLRGDEGAIREAAAASAANGRHAESDGRREQDGY